MSSRYGNSPSNALRKSCSRLDSPDSYVAVFLWYNHIILTFAVACYGYVAAFCRFTRSRLGPRIYTYKLSAAGDKLSARFAPFLEMAFATLVLFQKTRTVAFFCYNVFNGLGIVTELRKSNYVGPDMAFQKIILAAYWSCSVL